MKRGKKSPRQKAKDLADKVFSLWIRARDIAKYHGICPLCGIRPIQVNFHFKSRGNMGTRYHEKNCVGACSGCNMNEYMDRREANKEKWHRKHIELFGEEAVKEVEILAKDNVKLSEADLLEIVDKYKEKQ